MGGVEILDGVERRRRWPDAAKRRILGATLAAGVSVAEVARANGVAKSLVFRGRRGDLLKVIWHDGQGACLFTKRLERGRFIWPWLADGAVTISSAQLSYLLDGIDWRMPQKTWRPQAVG